MLRPAGEAVSALLMRSHFPVGARTPSAWSLPRVPFPRLPVSSQRLLGPSPSSPGAAPGASTHLARLALRRTRLLPRPVRGDRGGARPPSKVTLPGRVAVAAAGELGGPVVYRLPPAPPPSPPRLTWPVYLAPRCASCRESARGDGTPPRLSVPVSHITDESHPAGAPPWSLPVCV